MKLPVTRKIAGTARAASGASKIPPNPVTVQKNLRAAARMEPSVVIGLLATLPAVANVPGIWETAANLQAGAGGKLDKPASGVISRVITDSSKDWIAKDQEAFVSAAEQFKANLETYRYNVQWVAGHVDSIGDAIAAYWITAAKIAQETYLRLATLQALALVPETRVAARVAMRSTGAQASASLSRTTAHLADFLKAGVGGVAAAMGGPAIWQLAFMRTTGTSQVDFARSAIDTADPARAVTFRPPPPPGGTLPDAQLFDWQVKTAEGAKPLDDVAKDQLTP